MVIFHSFWKLHGVTNIHSLCAVGLHVLLGTDGSEWLQTVAGNDGSSRPGSCVVVANHLWLRLHKLLRRTGLQKAWQNDDRCMLLYMSVQKQPWTLYSTVHNPLHVEVGKYLLGLATVHAEQGKKLQALVQWVSFYMELNNCRYRLPTFSQSAKYCRTSVKYVFEICLVMCMVFLNMKSHFSFVHGIK